MAYEIERKFLVRDGWRAAAGAGRSLRQAYLAHDGTASVRVRIVDAKRATLTIKAPEASLRRQEFEYEIPIEHAEAMLALRQGSIVEKVRFRVLHGQLTWEVDVFGGDNLGLVIAEIELRREDQALERPDWLGEEITGDVRYYNASLAKRPFRSWRQPIGGGDGR
jgi:adenylate cyclase